MLLSLARSLVAELAGLVVASQARVFEFEEEVQRWAWVVQVAVVS